MTIQTELNGTGLYVQIKGRIDTSTAKEAEERLKGAVGGVTELTLDFKELDYISSAGLRLLLTLQKIMNKQGRMTIRNVNDVISEIFEVTGFSDVLTIE